MTSIRQQVLQYIKTYPYKTLKEVKKEFKDCPTNTIRTYYKQFKDISNDIKEIDIRTELIKIIKDYKTPASARVQAIREYNNLIEKEPDKTGEDSYLKFLEKQNLRIATTEDISLSQ